MNFIETTESAWSAEQLAAAEREIEDQKREWERNRLAAMKEEEERRARELEEEGDIITFSREDATNQVSTKNKKVYRSKKLLNKSRNIKKAGGKLVRRTRIAGGAKVRVRGVKKRNVGRKTNAVKTEPLEDEIVDMEMTEEYPTLALSQMNGETDSLDSTESMDNVQIGKPVSNHVDHNSPRTRSRGTVAINLWTLDVSPILPGEKPLRKITDPTERRKRHRAYLSEDDKSQSDDEREPNKFHFKRKLGRSKKDSVSSVDEGDDAPEIKSFNLKDVGEDGQLTEIINKGKVCHVLLSDVIAEGQYSLPEISVESQSPEEESSILPEPVEEESSLNDATRVESEVTNESTSEPVKEEEQTIELHNSTTTDTLPEKETEEEKAPEPPTIVEKERPKENIESNNKLEKTSSRLDNGLDVPKKAPGKTVRKNSLKLPESRRTYRRFGRGGGNNKTLDTWVRRGKQGNVTVNSKNAEGNVEEASKAIKNESVTDPGQTLPTSDTPSSVVGTSSDSKPD